MTDHVDWLRGQAHAERVLGGHRQAIRLEQAADEIERLTAERDALRVERDELMGIKRPDGVDDCPQCGDWVGLKYPRRQDPYCEECGWPDEDFSAV